MTKKRYHINPETGRPGVCNPKKTGTCKFGEGTIHGEFESLKEARQWANTKNDSSFGKTINQSKRKVAKVTKGSEREELEKYISNLEKETEDLRLEKETASPERKKEINGILRGKGIHLARSWKKLRSLPVEDDTEELTEVESTFDELVWSSDDIEEVDDELYEDIEDVDAWTNSVLEEVRKNEYGDYEDEDYYDDYEDEYDSYYDDDYKKPQKPKAYSWD